MSVNVKPQKHNKKGRGEISSKTISISQTSNKRSQIQIGQQWNSTKSVFVHNSNNNIIGKALLQQMTYVAALDFGVPHLECGSLCKIDDMGWSHYFIVAGSRATWYHRPAARKQKEMSLRDVSFWNIAIGSCQVIKWSSFVWSWRDKTFQNVRMTIIYV